MGSQPRIPKVFISYSWTSEEHKEWVRSLAVEPRESGVDAILDQWDLREGHDAHAFMEKMVTDPDIDRVILVCDARYVDKANARSGGVGTEAQIISPAIYESTDQRKFVAVVRERNADGQAYLPIYYGSRIYIDMSDAQIYPANFEQLVRWIFDRPVHVKPPVGKRPTFLEATDGPSLGSSASSRRALDAIRLQKAHSLGSTEDYFETCAIGLENFRIWGQGKHEFDDDVVASIEAFVPFRNEIIEVISALMRFERSEHSGQKIHRFLERLLTYYDVPSGTTQYGEWDFDNLKFVVHELFLYVMASALKSERFDIAQTLLGERYFLPANDMRPSRSVSFVEFRDYLKSLEHRNKRLKLRRLSVHADLLRSRCKGIGIDFRALGQADFLLFLRSCVDVLTNIEPNTWPRQWWPETLLFSRDYHGPAEVFARSESATYFNKVKGVIGVRDKAGLSAVLEALHSGQLNTPKWEFERVNTKTLLGFDKLATKP
jgi:hypothetical protein